MADPRNPEFEDFPSEAYLDPQSFLSALQAQDEKQYSEANQDRGIFGIATLILAGIGGYAALRHFPPRRIGALAKEVKDILVNPKRYGLTTPEIDKVRTAVDRMSSVILKQPWGHVHQDKFGEVLGSIRAANDPEILRTLQTISEIAGRNPEHFANVNAVQQLVKSPLLRPIPQDSSGLRNITLGDLFSPSGKYRWAERAPEPLQKIQNIVTQITQAGRIPGLADNIKLFNMRLDPGLYIKRGEGTIHNLVDLRGMHPANWISGLQRAASNTKLGFSPRMAAIGTAAGLYAGWDKDDPVSTIAGGLGGMALGSIPVRHLARFGRWATELLLPTNLLVKGPSHGVFGPELIRKYTGRTLTGATGTIVANGKLHPVFSGGHVGEAIAEGIRIGRADTVMGRAAAAARHESFIVRQLAKKGVSRGEDYIAQRAAEGRPVGPVGSFFIRAGDAIGVGPQYKRGRAPTAAELGDIPTDEPIPNILKGLWTDPQKTIRRMVTGFWKRLSGKDRATNTGQAEYYTFRAAEGLKDFANYQLTRVGHLFESTTTLGLKAGHTLGETAKTWAKVGATAFFGFEALRYLDYHSRRMIGTGPLSAPLQAYTAVRNVEQHLLAATGIQQSAAYLENLMPGVINSPLSALVRTVAINRLFKGMAPLGGTFGKGLAETLNLTRFGTKGAILGGAIAATQLTDITESPVHLAAVYRGEVDVPVREGRGWFLGTTPFGGGRITHTRPHLIPTILSHAREIGTYGSESGYWGAQFGLPVPEAWFGLKPLLFPYATEQAQYETRPTPITGDLPGVIGQLPFIGHAFSSTVGELIKPTQRWHKEATEPGFGGPGAAIGFDPIQGQRDVSDPTTALNRIGRQIDLLKDFLGMPGFMLGAIKKTFTGSSDFETQRRQLQTFSSVTGWERPYYDMQLGGMLGMSEFFRRLLPHRSRQIEQVNPVTNMMPDFIPGSGSAFPADRNFPIDYHKGDAYSLTYSGEARLPGAGYESLHRLQSGIPGVYGPLDRWKILRDIAPTSQAFRHYDTLVRSWAMVASRGPNDGDPFRMSLNGIVREVLDGDTLIIDVDGNLKTVRLGRGDAPEISHGAKGQDRLDPTRLGEGYAAKQALERAALNRAATVDVSGLDPYGRLIGDVTVQRPWAGRTNVTEQLSEAYPSQLTTGQIGEIVSSRKYLQDRFSPYPFTNRIFSDPSAMVPRNMRDLTSTSLTAINQATKATGQFTLPEKLVGNVWEQLSHVNLPGPLNWPFNKFFAQRDPLEIYRRNTLLGGNFAQWENPIKSYVVPWAHQAVGFVNPNYIPGVVRAQRQAMAQVDALEYQRNQSFEEQAVALGNARAAKEFKRRKMSTMSAVILTGNRRFARSALNRTDRGFYDAFATEGDLDRRSQILATTSPQMGTMLKMAWGTAQRGDIEAQRALVTNTQAPEGWEGMHPDITPQMLKVKVTHDHAWDFHELGLSQRDNYATEDVFSDAFEIPGPPITFSARAHARTFAISNRMGLKTHTITTEDSFFGPSVSARLSKDSRRFQHVINNYGYASMGARF